MKPELPMDNEDLSVENGEETQADQADDFLEPDPEALAAEEEELERAKHPEKRRRRAGAAPRPL